MKKDQIVHIVNMATGGEPNDVIVGATSVGATGSEAVYDHVCGPCSDEHTREAVGFCVDCDDWLCDECFRVHKRSKLSKRHVLVTADEMKTSSPGPKTVDKCTEKCDRHGDKRIKYFCKDHDFLGCSKCIIETHRTCTVQNILDISIDADVKTEFQQTTADLEAIAKQSNELVTDLKKNIAHVKQNKTQSVKAFRKYKKELVESLDKIEVALEDSCNRKEEEETERLEKIVESCGELEKASLQTKAQLKVYEDKGQHCNMFVAMKKNKNKVIIMKDNIRKAQGSSGVTLYIFQPSLKVSKLLESPDGMGTLVGKGRQRNNTDYSKIQAKHLTDISVKSEGSINCAIKGSALLPGQKLVLTDFNNCEVKVVDTNQNKLLSTTKIDGQPRTVCKVSDSSVAVTVEHKKEILFFSVHDTGKLTTIKTLAVRGRCRDVAATDDRIIVTYMYPDKMEIMDMNGSVLHTFGANHQGQQLLSGPKYVSLSPDKKYVYVSNYNNSRVTCMSLDGTVTAVYKDDKLWTPEQIAVDSNGMIYVACNGSSNVHLITPDCKKIKVVLSKSNGLRNVYAVSYCEESNRLYIGTGNGDVIKVFQLA